ncbi:MAG: molybdenum cofactor guanylyltransferase, partial [Candidatus Lokiarchaeota archaeon]
MIFISLLISQTELAIAILIGGKSTRFGSDKGIFQIRNRPMISYQLDTLSKIDYKIFLVAKSKSQMHKYINNIDIKPLTGFIIDETPNLKEKRIYSPLIGLYSLFKDLKKLNLSKVLVLSCDLPLIKQEIIKYLLQFAEKYDCVIPRWQNGYLEPLCAIYSIKKGLKSSKSNIMSQNYKLT